jgi:Flp pilus assembly protein TadG
MTKDFWSKLSGKLKRFFRSSRGNVAITFALCAIPLVVGAGAAVDLSRALIVRGRLVHALDAAALAVGKTPNLTVDEAKDLATKFFNAN